MNLDLPFQHSIHGLAIVIALMVVSTASIFFYFWRKRWI
jgi:Mg2+ and Co2+ transporter CorA